MSWKQRAGVQQLVPGRDLVTYWTGSSASWLVSNSPDWLFAIGARARRFRNRESDRHCPVCLTNGGGCRSYWPCGIRAWSRTADASGSECWDQTTLCNAGTLADRTWAPTMVDVQKAGAQIRASHPARTPNKTEENKRRKLFSESSRRRRNPNKTEE